MPKTYIKTGAAANILSASTGTILKLIKLGEIRARRNPGHWPNAGYAVDLQSLLDFIERRRRQGSKRE